MIEDAQHRIVAWHVDPTIMAQPGVGERRQPASGLTVVGDNGLAREVAAGHHEYVRSRRVADKSEEQPMYGRIGKHDPEIGRVRRDVSSQLHSPVGASLQQDHGAPRIGQQAPLGVAEQGQPRRRASGSATMIANGLSRGPSACTHATAV
jgi:hypothetical protein